MGEESVWIGPSKCDEHRSAREKDIEEIWSKLISTKGFKETYSLFGSAIDLLREALSCYQNGAYMATALMCRACIETALYLLISREPKWEKEWGIVQEVKVNYNYIKDEWKCILCRAKMHGYIDNKIEQRIENIRNSGNFVAHYGQKYDDELRKMIKNIEDKNEIRSWIKKGDSLQTLRETVNVLSILIEKTFDRCLSNKANHLFP
jgi:hypothetical protein